MMMLTDISQEERDQCSTYLILRPEKKKSICYLNISQGRWQGKCVLPIRIPFAGLEHRSIFLLREGKIHCFPECLKIDTRLL